MKLNDVYPSRFLSAADLQGQDAIATIDRVEFDDFEGQKKPLVFFRGKAKGLVCNKTNFRFIAAIAGDDTDDWPGARIVIYPTMVDFKGQTTEAIRVRRPPETKPAEENPKAEASDPLLNDSIPF